MKFRFSDSMLLELALRQLRTDKIKFEKQCFIDLQLRHATLVGTQRVVSNKTIENSDQKLYSDDQIFTTPTHNISCTKYGRIKQVEKRAVAPKKPQVIRKVRKQYTK